jgi:hypothetical protein
MQHLLLAGEWSLLHATVLRRVAPVYLLATGYALHHHFRTNVRSFIDRFVCVATNDRTRNVEQPDRRDFGG